MWNDFAHAFLVVFTGLLPVINPPSTALVVLSLVPDASDKQRAGLAARIAFYGVVLLTVSIWVGAYVLAFFGISIPVLRVAGGLVVAAAGWKLLQAPARVDHTAAAAVGHANVDAVPDAHGDASLADQAFFPLTLPITVGPGSIAVAIALGTSSPGDGLRATHIVAVACAIALLGACIYVCVRYAGALSRMLGGTGTQITVRLMAFVIFCIGVEITWLGVSELLGRPA
ncbi:MarC family protein [Lysobacter changpingensis]|jgi:multiple antibiotic resistance protein|uniref:MarC family protein n=1 Tax=Lysobacter changpingensis TaxID=2792784 RepID=UPI001A8BFC5B|nr:MarC family protein [Lysobacter changpingensis]